jgi:ABC-type phosphate/phosphonate transport system substrate-binding protein
MSSPAPRLTNQWIPLSFAFFVLLIFFLGCSGGGDTKEVDFSDTVQVARPGERPSADHYRQILDYISSHIDKESKLIQRKTYDEINELFGKGEIDLAFICSGPYATSKDKYGFEKERSILLLSVQDRTPPAKTSSVSNCLPPLKSKEAISIIPT